MTERMIEIYQESKRRYGAPEIHHLLVKERYRVSLKRLMKKSDIKSITVKKFRPTPSKEKLAERENTLQRDFSTHTINEKWVGDITYIYTLKHGWYYLASVMDLHTKKIIGFSFGRTMTTEWIITALNNAYETLQPDEGLIFHSHLGSQYTSDEFTKVMEQLNMVYSFSYKGSLYDNACIESFHVILKKEEVNQIQYIDEKSARMVLFQYKGGIIVKEFTAV